ncbi:MAG: tetratricopeptide repeat protein [Terriglobia bacterium]
MAMRGSSFLGLLILLLFGSVASAQRPSVAAFAGVVLGEDGQPLAGATVVIQSLEIELRREVQTDSKGQFYHGGFHPGRYLITIVQEGKVVWSLRARLPHFREVERFEINLKQLHEAAAKAKQLAPELAQRRDAAREQRRAKEQRQRQIQRGNRLLDGGDAEGAIREFEALRALEPENHLPFAYLGAAYAAAGRSQDAMQAYRSALELAPREAAHHNNLATLLVGAGQLEEALEHFARAARLDQARAATYEFNRGAALLNAGRLEEALRALRQATRRDPAFALAHYFQGVALLRRSSEGKQRAAAVTALRRYLELSPTGAYADQARQHLRQLGAPAPELPRAASSPEGRD